MGAVTFPDRPDDEDIEVLDARWDAELAAAYELEWADMLDAIYDEQTAAGEVTPAADDERS